MEHLKLGQLIEGEQHRDAIHIAVYPVTAGARLFPGKGVGFEAGSTERVQHYGTTLGIVDPFLTKPVEPGERCWMFLYPNTITSLRHDWTHPAIADAAPASVTPSTSPSVPNNVAQSREWIESFAAQMGYTYDRLMRIAEDYAEHEDYERDDSESYKDHWDKFPEFWSHYEQVTGKTIEEKDAVPFTCSC